MLRRPGRPACRASLLLIPSGVVAAALLAPVTPAARLAAQAPGPQPSLEQAVRRARDRVFPTLVHIRPVFDTARGGELVETQSVGSGVIISTGGLVVTNFHVAGTAKRVVCTLADRRRVSAELVGADAATDVALLRLHLDEVALEQVVPAAFAASRPLETGQFVLAMGSPLGLTRSLSLGVVSCTDRYLPPMVVMGHIPTGTFNTWIQTDAAINPGNSGGPLVDLAGEIVGINTRGYRGAENLGFAIPAAVVKETVKALLRDGRVIRSEIGLRLQPLPGRADAGAAESDDLGGARGAGEGALVAAVEPGSPADRAGLRAGDLLLEYAGRPVLARFEEDLPELARRMAGVAAGESIEVSVRRGAERLVFAVETREWQPAAVEDRELAEVGLTLRQLTESELRKRAIDGRGGALVTGVRRGGRAARAAPPLEVGDVILAAGGFPVAAPEELEERLEATFGRLVLTARRGFGDYLVVLPPRGEEGP